MNANGLYSGVEGYVIPGTNSGVGTGVANGVYGELGQARPGFLDFYPGALVAFSLRKLRIGYIGPAIRVRRSSDNVELDIGFDVNGNLDEKTLLGFVGSGNSGFVTTWYNQSTPLLNDAVQTSNVNQPRIVLNGVVNKQNNKPTINFIQANSTRFILNDVNLLQTGPISVTATLGTHGTGGSQDFFGTRVQFNAGGWEWFYRVGPIYRFAAISIGGTEASVSTTALPIHTMFGTITGPSSSSTFRLWLNNFDVRTGNQTINPGPVSFALGYGGASGQGYMDGNFYEFIAYTSDQSNNVTGIRQEVNNYYKIY
jgi:hypothetical protein